MTSLRTSGITMFDCLKLDKDNDEAKQMRVLRSPVMYSMARYLRAACKVGKCGSTNVCVDVSVSVCLFLSLSASVCFCLALCFCVFLCVSGCFCVSVSAIYILYACNAVHDACFSAFIWTETHFRDRSRLYADAFQRQFWPQLMLRVDDLCRFNA